MPEHSMEQLLTALETRKAIPPPPKKLTKYRRNPSGWYGATNAKVRHRKRPNLSKMVLAKRRWDTYAAKAGWYGKTFRDDVLLDMVAAGMRYDQIKAYTGCSDGTIGRAVKRGRQTLEGPAEL